jgi:photosystem II stability/assembly factor-like uncharacterized protein
LRLALAAFALMLAPQAPAQDVEREDPAAEPAVIAPLAERSLLLDLAWAGPRVFAVGERGHVLHSGDAGRTWVQSPVPASANLTAVYFADDKHGWAVGHVEAILATSDGGESWRLAHFEPDNPQPLLDVAFADALRGVAVGAYGVIYVTADGGSVWSQVPFEPEALPGAEKVAAAPDEMEADVDLGFEFHLNSIARGGPGRMYIGAEAGRLFRTDDDGAHWRELPSPYDGSFHGVLPLEGDALLAFGLRGNLFRSDDGGATWADRAAVDERNAPASTVNPEDGVGGGDAQVAPQREFEAARHGVALDRGDHRLAEQHARGPHGAVAVVVHLIAATLAHGLEVRPGAEGSAGAGQHGDASVVVGVEAPERVRQRRGRRAVDAVLHFRAVDGDDRNRSVEFVADRLAHARDRARPMGRRLRLMSRRVAMPASATSEPATSSSSFASSSMSTHAE